MDDENMSISALGCVFGLYTIPTILFLLEHDSSSINSVSTTCGMKMLRS